MRERGQGHDVLDIRLEHDLDAAILRAACGGSVRIDRVEFAVARGGERLLADAARDQEVNDHERPSRGKLPVRGKLLGYDARRVGVPGNLEVAVLDGSKRRCELG